MKDNNNNNLKGEKKMKKIERRIKEVKIKTDEKKENEKMTRNILKTFGVKKTCNGRFTIVSNIEISHGRLFYHEHGSPDYKNFDFAIKEAESLFKGYYKNYTDLQNNQIVYSFKNMGLIE